MTAIPAVQFSLNFNSHARVGRDLKLIQIPCLIFHFNSHARVGRDSTAIAYALFFLFQLTRPCRA